MTSTTSFTCSTYRVGDGPRGGFVDVADRHDPARHRRSSLSLRPGRSARSATTVQSDPGVGRVRRPLLARTSCLAAARQIAGGAANAAAPLGGVDAGSVRAHARVRAVLVSGSNGAPRAGGCVARYGAGSISRAQAVGCRLLRPSGTPNTARSRRRGVSPRFGPVPATSVKSITCELA